MVMMARVYYGGAKGGLKGKCGSANEDFERIRASAVDEAE